MYLLLLAYTGDVKTLTLALHGLYTVYYNIDYLSFIFTFHQRQSAAFIHFAFAERGLSAMSATHTKERQEMSHEQVCAHMAVQYNCW